MSNIFLVAVADCRNHLDEDFLGLMLRKNASVLKVIEQLASFAKT